MMQFSGTNLTCIRRQSVVFEKLGFSVEGGKTAALTGPNGSGKTSLLRVMAGLLEPAHGRLLWNNEDITPDIIQNKTHWAGLENPLKQPLTIMENMKFWARALGAGCDDDAILKALDHLGMARLATTRTQYLSTGQLKRASLCRLFLVDRPLWLLDEPANGLDSQTADTLRHLVEKHVKNGGMAVIATHRPSFWNAEIQIDMGVHASPTPLSEAA